MDLRSLIAKMDAIEEAAAPADPRAQYDQFRADDAKAAAVAQVQQMLTPAQAGPNGTSANFIDPKDGIIKYIKDGSTVPYSYDWAKAGQNPEFFNILKTAGLQVIPVAQKTLLGTSQVAGVDPTTLTAITQPTPAPTPAPAPAPSRADAASDAFKKEHMANLQRLLAQLKATGLKEGFNFNSDSSVTLLRRNGTQVTFDPVTMQIFGGMSSSLMESFGYVNFMTESDLNEYSWDQLGSDAADLGRGVASGATMGLGDYAAAGAKSAMGGGTYQQELDKWRAGNDAAEKRSPWLYGGGQAAGTVGTLIGTGGAGAAVKGAAVAGKAAQAGAAAKTAAAAPGIGARIAKGVDAAKTWATNPATGKEITTAAGDTYRWLGNQWGKVTASGKAGQMASKTTRAELDAAGRGVKNLPARAVGAAARNPGKTAAAVGAGALAAGAAMSGGSTPTPTPVVRNKPNPNTHGSTTGNTTVAPQQDLIKQIQDEMANLAQYGDNGDQEVVSALQNAQAAIDSLQGNAAQATADVANLPPAPK